MEIERAERNFNAERGFGFIGPDDSGKDVFVHLCGMPGRGVRFDNNSPAFATLM
jgi:cold shock CspA family protein